MSPPLVKVGRNETSLCVVVVKLRFSLGVSNLLEVEGFSAQVRKSVDSPPDMLTEDHHHTVHEERQVCYSSHLRPKSLHL